ncbi:hypothetical protein DPX16_16518 [Anabarilius grahami]|uniref:Uncharacterized protein n=1 Tax=Anabarilius grahami TaxID=495550 RepID=A0A3N0XUY2_ANAGA|nr:hypothetical protein DPX16_16518 [Anabarilius grahami]
MDIANALVWAPMTAQPHIVSVNTADFLSGQTFQEVCILVHMQEPVVPPHTKGGAVWLHIQQTVVPPYTKGGAVWLHIQCGQTLNHMLGSLTLSPKGVNDQTNALAKTGTRHNNLCFLLIQTVNSMKQLFTVFQNDFAQNQLVMALMTDLLREVSFSMDRVAMNRIPQYPMQTVLDFATDRPTWTVPAHLANSLGAAILLHVDPKQNEVAVLLNLPSGEPDNISRPKDKVNVRWWQCNTHAKKHTSDVIAYHNSNPRLCLAPHFCRCSVTKDFQHFCLNQLFLRNHTEGMGRLLLMISDTRCPAEAKPRTQVIGTQAKIVGDRLLVHTPTHAATLTYNQYNTTTRVSLPNPKYQSKLEIPSSSRNHHHTLDPGLELRIDKGGSQLSDSTPIDAALQALSRLPVLTSSRIAQAWTAANTALCLSMAIGYALTLGLAFILFKKMKGMRESMDKCLPALPRGNGDMERKKNFFDKVMLLARLKEEEFIVVREVKQHMEYMKSVAGQIEEFTFQLTEDTNGKCSTEGLMENGREGLLCVLKRRLCEVAAQLATARTTYKSILGLQTLPLDDFSEEEDSENTSSTDEELGE